jgi:transposase
MKSTLQKKRKSDKKYVIASAGRSKASDKSQCLHANLADDNGSSSIRNHYNELINKGLNAEGVDLVVTDMLVAYQGVIKDIFPNALHQYCVFHFIQHINGIFKTALKEHRIASFKEGARKEAHLTSFLLLKGKEKLKAQEREKVLDFCEAHPTIGAAYALKEEIRTLYATVKTISHAVALKDIIEEKYSDLVCKTMKKGIDFLTTHFDGTIAYLKKGYFLDKTNNDAESMMRTIKRTQQTHYFFRTDDAYIKKIRAVLGIQQPFAT